MNANLEHIRKNGHNERVKIKVYPVGGSASAGGGGGGREKKEEEGLITHGKTSLR